MNIIGSMEILSKKGVTGEHTHPLLSHERRYNISAAPINPEAKTVPVQKPGAVFGVAGDCVLPVVVSGGAAGGVRVVSPGDTGVVVPGAGVTGLSGVEVGAGVPDDDGRELLEPEDDVAVAVGAATSRNLTFPLRATSKVFVINCVSLHRGSWMITVLPPDPTRVNWTTARGIGSVAKIPSVLMIATFAYPMSLSIPGITFEFGISLLAEISSTWMIFLS